MEIRGKEVAEKIRIEIKEKVENLALKGIVPKLAIIRVGNREDDVAYEKRILKNAKNFGVKVQVCEIGTEEATESFEEKFNALNEDEDIHGILLFRPLADKRWEDFAKKNIKPEKDVDCMCDFNLARPYFGLFDGILPATPSACLEILKHYDLLKEGNKVTVVNRSMVLGKPLSMMLLSHNATVTFCHSKTKNLKEITRSSDIVITGIGKAGFFDETYFNENSIVIDVGINFDCEGMVGDVKRGIKDRVRAITPVPGGVGIVTSTILFRNLLKNIKN